MCFGGITLEWESRRTWVFVFLLPKIDSLVRRLFCNFCSELALAVLLYVNIHQC